MRSAVRLAALLLALLAIAGAARARLDREAQQLGRIRDPTWLPRGEVVRTASMGQRLLLSDLYWLRTVQYIGETVLLKRQRWEALYPLSDLVTDLDPRFGYAYQVAGSNLAGLAHRYDEADKILLKGMRNIPDRWSLPMVMGINKFLYQEDYPTAAEYIRRASVVGDKPHLALLAANLAALANTDAEYDTAVAFLDQAIETAGTPELKEELATRRARTLTFQALSHLERAIAAYVQRNGVPPPILEALLAAGVLTRLPRVPEEAGAIIYDPITGKVRSENFGPREPLRVTTPNK